MIDCFGLIIELSNDALDGTTAFTRVAPGASLIEKCLTLDLNGGVPDDSFSLEPPEFVALCHDAETAKHAIAQIYSAKKSSEQGYVKFWRSPYFVKDLKAWDVITECAVSDVRLGGIHWYPS